MGLHREQPARKIDHDVDTDRPDAEVIVRACVGHA